MSIKLRKESAGAVAFPESTYVQLFIDVDGLAKTKDSDGKITTLSQPPVVTLPEQESAPAASDNALKLYSREVNARSELFALDSSGAEIQITSGGTIVGTGTGGGLMPLPGLFGSPGVGQFSVADTSELVMLPAATAPGQRAGVYAIEAASVASQAGQLLIWGEEFFEGPSSPLTLQAGAYAEWVFCDLGDDLLGWLPAGASNEQQASGGGGSPNLPYVVGPPTPNSWVLASENDKDVYFPNAPPTGTIVGVYCDEEMASVFPGFDDSILHHDLFAQGNASTGININGPEYYEWMYLADNFQWRPHETVRLQGDIPHGSRGGGSLHQIASTVSNGFMSTQQVQRLEALPLSFVIAKPVNSHLWDDEFNSLTNPESDPQLRGWTVRNVTTSTVMTRVGDIEAFSADPGTGLVLARNEYRSTLRGTFLLFQIAGNLNDQIVLYKASTHASNAPSSRYVVRAHSVHSPGVPSAASLFVSTSGVPAFGLNQAHCVGHYYDATKGGHIMRHWITGGTGPSDTFEVQGFGAYAMDTFMWDNGSAWVVEWHTGGVQYQGVKLWTLGNIQSAGLLFLGSGGPAQLHSIDFMRRAPFGSWFNY